MASKSLHAIGRVSRADIADNQAIWLLYAVMFAAFSVGEIGLAFILPRLRLETCLPFGLVLAAIAGTALRTRPPALGTAANHVSIATIYVAVVLGMLAFQPFGLIPLSPVMFFGPYAASRLTGRAQIAAHCAAASLLLGIPAALGAFDESATFGAAVLIPAIWLITFCVVAVLEAAEAQGQELEQLVRRDPLTGLGNRRMLDEQLAAELDRHAAAGLPLSILALDLNGFKALNDTVGHAAGDAALQEVAAALRGVAREHDTVVRQGGDEFCLLLAESSAADAEFVATAIRTDLARLAEGDLPITTGIGIATFPADAGAAATLLAVADARLGVDKERTDPANDPRRGAPTAWAARAEPRVPVQVAEIQTGNVGLVSRRALARNPRLWFATGGVFTLVGIFTLAVAALLPGAPAWGFGLGAAITAVGVGALVAREAPALDTWPNHALLAALSLSSAGFAAAFPSAAGASLGTAIFIGPQIAVRLIDRRKIVAHLAASSLVFLLLIPAGLTDLSTSLSLGIMLLGVWGLGGACAAVLEAAERQGDELDALVRRDPLTGLGNRRKLTEQLSAELARHARTRRPFTVLALDLNGFKALNDEFGHAAGDELLVAVARAIEAEVGPEDTVVRQGGDEFCVLLADQDGDRAAGVAGRIRDALAEIDAHGLPITTGVGIASYPTEGTTDALLDVADQLLRESKATADARGRRVRDAAATREAA